MTSLPLPRERATREQNVAAPRDAPRLEGTRALVVDDEPDARELLEVVLGTYGIVTASVGSAAAAIEHLKGTTVDVLVCDIGMPEEDGYSLIRRIRTMPDEAKKNVPAIALTAFARNEDRTKALLAGFNAHLAKPVDPSTLVAMMADVLGRHAKPG
jgi:CheY-like chemotaxis protein